MTIDLALEYIPRRMKEMGHGNNYHIRFRHLVLQAAEQRELQADNQLYLLLDEPQDIRIDSDSGLFDWSESSVNELTYEHTGTILISNYAPFVKQVRWIQIIPTNF